MTILHFLLLTTEKLYWQYARPNGRWNSSSTTTLAVSYTFSKTRTDIIKNVSKIIAKDINVFLMLKFIMKGWKLLLLRIHWTLNLRTFALNYTDKMKICTPVRFFEICFAVTHRTNKNSILNFDHKTNKNYLCGFRLKLTS